MPLSILEYSGECPRATDKRFKIADKMVKVKNKAWHSEGVGGQQVLEGFQCCLAHCSLKELVPQDHSSWEGWCLTSGSGGSESRGL